MNNMPESKVAVWTSPKLVKLGKIEDVAPTVAGLKEGINNKS
ncbi:MAG: hypothetical protein ACKOQM_01125 [Novosphingobium sp.]